MTITLALVAQDPELARIAVGALAGNGSTPSIERFTTAGDELTVLPFADISAFVESALGIPRLDAAAVLVDPAGTDAGEPERVVDTAIDACGQRWPRPTEAVGVGVWTRTPSADAHQLRTTLARLAKGWPVFSISPADPHGITLLAAAVLAQAADLHRGRDAGVR
jgi:hypothetical protein